MFLIDFFKAVGRLFKKIFSSPQAQAVMMLILKNILPTAVPIVAGIREFIEDPANATVTDILKLYGHFQITVDDVLDNPTAKANALLNLATQLLDAALPKQYSTPLLHSAIELALSGLKAEE